MEKPRYSIVLSHKAEKSFQKLQEPHKKRVAIALEALAYHPNAGKSLKGGFEGVRSLRVWPYRIMYEQYETRLLINVIDIGHRQGVYKQ